MSFYTKLKNLLHLKRKKIDIPDFAWKGIGYSKTHIYFFYYLHKLVFKKNQMCLWFIYFLQF